MPSLAFGPGCSALIRFERWVWPVPDVANLGPGLRRFHFDKDRMRERIQDANTVYDAYAKMNVQIQGIAETRGRIDL